MSAVVLNLLLLYAGLLLINTALTGVLWWRNRDPLFRALFFVWATTAFSFVVQGALQQNETAIILAFVSVFPVNLALAKLLGLAIGIPVLARRYVIALGVAVLAFAGLTAGGAEFWQLALPVTLAVAAPTFVTGLRALVRWRALSVAGKGLVIASLLFSLHNLDFAFLRDDPSMAPLGFTIATLIIFALSVTGPAVVLEIVADRQARVATEMEAARRIQTRILPAEPRLPGLEVVTHMRPSDSVGGDYFDVIRHGDDCWILLGDVTGHGLGAGLVTLMAQSTLGSILEARPDISPRELNHIANRVLSGNLARLEEKRHMTIVALRRRGDAVTVSGSHDDIYVYRATSREVQTLPVTHFPWGLGFLPNLGPGQVREETIELHTGDVLFVGTDGVTEAAFEGDHARGIFGAQRVVELLAAEAGTRPLPEIKARLLGELDRFTRGIYHDDVAFVMVRALPPAAEKAA